MTVPIEFLRALSATYLPDLCTIERATETYSGDGTVQSWATHLSGVACRVSPLASGAGEALGADASLQAVAQWTVWLSYNTDITVRDRIIYNGRTFEAARIGARSYETVREVIAREIT